MNKKILFALSIVIVAIVAMGTVSAFEVSNLLPIDLGSVFGGESDQDITLDGVTFHIPGSFEENPSVSKNGVVEDYGSFTTVSYERGYLDGTTFINVRVVEYDGIDLDESLINYMDGSSKTINGVNGYQYYDGIGYTFTYSMGDKVITIQSDNEDLFAKVL